MRSLPPAVSLERDAVIAALRDNEGKVSRAARALGASRRTLQNRMREYGLPWGKPGRRKRLLPYGRALRPLPLVGALVGVAGVVAGGALAIHRFTRRAPAVGETVGEAPSAPPSASSLPGFLRHR